MFEFIKFTEYKYSPEWNCNTNSCCKQHFQYLFPKCCEIHISEVDQHKRSTSTSNATTAQPDADRRKQWLQKAISLNNLPDGVSVVQWSRRSSTHSPSTPDIVNFDLLPLMRDVASTNTIRTSRVHFARCEVTARCCVRALQAPEIAVMQPFASLGGAAVVADFYAARDNAVQWRPADHAITGRREQPRSAFAVLQRHSMAGYHSGWEFYLCIRCVAIVSQYRHGRDVAGRAVISYVATHYEVNSTILSNTNWRGSSDT